MPPDHDPAVRGTPPLDQPADAARPGLTDRDRAILDFERDNTFWRQPGAKEQAIRTQFGLGSITYYQLLNRLLDHEEAVGYAPTVVNRLRILRESRTRRTRRS